ncbi:hypothetical protein JCM6882_008011 [Rhodosporidiobolus microsporus]
MLVPLNPIDNPEVDISLTLCWVYVTAVTEESAAAHEERLKAAAERVVRKWPLLAGVPKYLGPGRWAIDVPDELDETSKSRSLVGFSSATHSKPYHVAAGLPEPLPPLATAPSGFSPTPHIPLFCPSSVPSTFAHLAKSNRPLLHVHATFFPDAIALGVTLPHGAFDGTGYGMVLRALNAELHGRGDWEVPPLWAENPLSRTVNALVEDEAVREEGKGASWELEGWRSFSLGGVMRMLCSLAAEIYWWRSEQRWMFLRQAAVDHLVERVKEDVKRETGGKEYVSSGDILVAWFLKAALADESTLSGSVASIAVSNCRSLLTSYAASSPSVPPFDFSLYPHGAVAPYDLLAPALPLSDLATTSLATLALAFRRNLDKQRNLSTLRACTLFHPTTTNTPSSIPHRDWPHLFSSSATASSAPGRGPTHRFFFTNQTSLGMASLALPALEDGEDDLPLVSYALTGRMPLLFDHAVALQRVEGAGIRVGGRIRRTRWESVGRAVEELEREADQKARRG